MSPLPHPCGNVLSLPSTKAASASPLRSNPHDGIASRCPTRIPPSSSVAAGTTPNPRASPCSTPASWQPNTHPAESAAPSLGRSFLPACGVIISSKAPTSTPATHDPLPTNLNSAYSNATTPTYTRPCARDVEHHRQSFRIELIDGRLVKRLFL